MQGKIVKGISGFYYVHVVGTGIYECKAKGVFRNRKVKPLVGDNVEIVVLDEEKHLGNVEEILPRKNELIRPAVSNIDMALVIFAAAKPDPNFNLLDRFLCMMEYQKVPVTICFNKCDLVSEEEKENLQKIYAPAGYDIVEEDESYFDLDTDELLLGDIMISVDKVFAQAEEYGHSVTREFCFLVAHSMLHLLGYDHMTPGEAAVMEAKQAKALEELGITR